MDVDPRVRSDHRFSKKQATGHPDSFAAVDWDLGARAPYRTGLSLKQMSL
jgi:hypothetical protein